MRAIILALTLMAEPVLAEDLPGGFVLGTSWDQAQAHAAAQGWAVTKDEFAPDQWYVSEAEVTLSVCEGRIVQLSRHFKGDMTDFLDEVDDLTLPYGQPSVHAVQQEVFGAVLRTTLAEFPVVDRLVVIASLSSVEGIKQISVIYRQGETCTFTE